MVKIIGLTGGIGSGKTTVINYIKSKGFPVYIADEAGKEVMEYPEIITKINLLFNNEVLLPDGFLDRTKIASIVFQNKELLGQLNQIVHPAVALHFENFKKENATADVIFKESAILFESEAYKKCDATILITAPLHIRVHRVMLRDQITEEEVLKRVKNQMDDSEKTKLATYIVENIDLNETFKNVDQIVNKILIN